MKQNLAQPKTLATAAADDQSAGAPRIPVTMEMIAAGVEIYRDWDSNIEDPETLVTAVFMAMRDRYFANSAPTERTKIISPARDRVIRRTLKRAAKRQALRIQFRLLALDFRKLRIECRYAALRMFRRFLCSFLQVVRCCGYRFPPAA